MKYGTSANQSMVSESSSYKLNETFKSDSNALKAENEKLKKYLQDYEAQINDLESELRQLK
jgi:cell division protein FtsB